MSKSFTCRELMGICDEIFYGDTLMEIVQKGMEHMGSDDAHKDHIAGLVGGSRETPLFKDAFDTFQILDGPGQPEDVANVILFLACDDSRFLTGVHINIDGGVAAKL